MNDFRLNEQIAFLRRSKGITQEELARALGISRKSAYQLLHDGIIGFKRIGKKYLVPKICVLDYINSARYTVHR